LLTEEGKDTQCFVSRETWRAPTASASLSKVALGGFEAQFSGFVKKTGGFDPNLHLAALGKKLTGLETNTADLESKSVDLRTNSADLSRAHSSGSEEESAARRSSK
jgi:hypothetical protein